MTNIRYGNTITFCESIWKLEMTKEAEGRIHQRISIFQKYKQEKSHRDISVLFLAESCKFAECNYEMCTLHHALIPHICHFFTQAKFLENKIYTEKRVNYNKLHSKLPIFRVKSVKIYTGQFFLHRHRLWCLTNMRYARM